MKQIFIFLFLISSIPYVFSQDRFPYKAHLTSWNNAKVTGQVIALSDSIITIRTTVGRVFIFKPEEIKHLKIWKRGINLPAALLGAAAGGAGLGSITANDSLRGVMITFGAFLGLIPGLITGDLISTAFNQRKMHIASFTKIKSRIE